MKYQGGKQRTVKYLMPFLSQWRDRGQAWVEPFVGGGNVIAHAIGERIGGDAFGPTIEALRIIRDHADRLPKNNTEFTKQDYIDLLRGNDNRWSWMAPFALFAYSFGGCYRSGFSRDTRGDDYIAQAYRSAQMQSSKLRGVNLVCTPYDRLSIPPRSFIYCDPPYAATERYKVGQFDHAAFWQWVRDKHNEGHTVFVSEYSAPADFVSCWSRTRTQGLRSARTSSVRKECVYVHESAHYGILPILRVA